MIEKNKNQFNDITFPSHYANHSIEPIDYVTDLLTKSNFTAMEGALVLNIIKYISRFPYKGTPVKDVEKAQWYLDRLVKLVQEERGEESDGITNT